jgi:hypothetical protein
LAKIKGLRKDMNLAHVNEGAFEGIIDSLVRLCVDALPLDVPLSLDEVSKPQLVASGKLLEGAFVKQFTSSEGRPRLKIEVAKPSLE